MTDDHKIPKSTTSPTQIQEKIIDFDQKINQLQAQKNALLNKSKKQNDSHRKRRTRTLIQLGGLVTLAQLHEVCGLEIGDDLQDDCHAKHKAEILLGILQTVFEQLPLPLSDTLQASFQEKGKRILQGSGLIRGA